MEKKCPDCENMVEGQNVSSNGFFITYYCDNCEEYIEDMIEQNKSDCKHRKDECECVSIIWP